MEFRRGDWIYGPYARLTHIDVDIDGYEESGAVGLNLKVENQSIESLTTAIGVQATFPQGKDWGVLVPQARVEWVHEYDDDSRTVESNYINEIVPTGGDASALTAETDSPDRDYLTIGLGISTVYKGGSQAFLLYETVLGLDDIEEHVFTGGLRMEF